MTDKESTLVFFKPSWLTSLSLLTLLYLMYSSTFLSDYLMNDEWAHIGSSYELTRAVAEYFFGFGRALFGVYHQFVYRFVEYDPFRIQLVRFLNFTSLAAISILLLRFIEVRSNNRWFAFFITLSLFSQPSIQGMMGYSLQLISNSQPSMWLSLLAFYLYFFFFEKHRLSKLLQLATVFLILFLAMQSTQTYALFGMVPLTYLVLSDWEHSKSKVWRFLLIALLVFLFSSFLYKIGLDFWHSQGRSGYKLGEQGLEFAASEPITLLLRAINPLSYWSAFEFWSYPFPLHHILPLGGLKRTIASIITFVWIALIIAAAITESRGCTKEEKWQIVLTWLAVLICLGFSAIFLVADSPQKIIEHRPHMTLIFVGIVIFSAAYSLQVIASVYPCFKNKFVLSAGILFVSMNAFGAQSGVLRGIVNNRMEQISFIRAELITRSPSDYKNIVVVLPSWRGCITEPCGPWMGSTTSAEWAMTREGAYRYALATLGDLPNAKSITFVQQRPNIIPRDSVIIDWNKYVLVRKRYLEYLRHH